MVDAAPSASYSLAIRFQLPDRAGALAEFIRVIAECEGNVGEVSLVERAPAGIVRATTVDAASARHAEQIVSALRAQPAVELLAVNDRTFALHHGGKIAVRNRHPLHTEADLAMAYTPGVGRVCHAIAQDPGSVFELTIKGNAVAIATDGSAVLGLGNLGAEAALPVMEGKAMLFREFGGIDAFPLCLAQQQTEALVETVRALAPAFGGINLEDISAPRCFAIERRLREALDIPVFHDDQHGTAIVVLAALQNALALTGKSLAEARIAINGMGAAGVAIARLLQQAGATDIWPCDSRGLISQQRTDLDEFKQGLAVAHAGSLADALAGADVFIGVSVPDALSPQMVGTMARDPILLALANPVPEIRPEAVGEEVAVMATGRSDYPNQINNVLAFPGVFRGALDCQAARVTPNMCLAAAGAIAALVPPGERHRNCVVPSVFDSRVAPAVAEAVRAAAHRDGVARAAGDR